jgi:hypothetical protein
MDQIQQFFAQNGITTNGISIQTNEFGYFVQAEKDLKVGDIVARIPKDSVLSVRNTAIADVIEEIEYGGVLGLCLAVLYEMSLGEKSPWHTYLEAIRVPLLPMFWDSKATAMLQGTDVGRAIIQDREFVTEDFNELILPLLPRYPILKKDFFTLDNWFKAHSIVSSRAFSVDDYHGESIVPVADLFNHHFEENVHFEIWNVCDLCGAAEEMCDCNNFEEQEDDEETAVSMEDDDIPDLEAENKALHSDEEADVSVLEMVVVNAVPKGAEVFNTYGKHSNASLLRLYGFLLDENPHSTVTIDREEVISAIKVLSEDFEDRIAYWDQVGKDLMEQLKDMEAENDDLQEEKSDCAIDGSCCTKDKSCCDEDGNCKAEDIDMENEDDWEDEESHSDNDEVMPDDFCFERNGPSFALLLFLNILLMKNSDFEQIAMTLDAAVPFFVTTRKEYFAFSTEQQENITRGKAKMQIAEYSQDVPKTLCVIASNRLQTYGPQDGGDDSEMTFTLASKLKEEEQSILRGAISKFSHL